METEKKRKKGSGRHKGSYNYCEATLEDLNRLFKPEKKIVLSRVWANINGVPNTPFKVQAKTFAAIPKSVEVQEIDFNES